MRRPETAAGPGKVPHVLSPIAPQPTDPRRVAHAPLAVDNRGLAVLLDCSERHVRAMNAAGRLPRALRLGRRRVWAISTIEAWLDAGAPTCAIWELRHEKGGAR